MSRISKLLLLSMIAVLALSACGGSSDAAAQVVQDYYQAVVSGDVDRATALSCPQWEGIAQMEVDSFQAVDATLDGFTCEKTGEDGDMTVISCQGQIVMSYAGEDQYLDLSGQSYQVQNVGGDWLFCGYR